MSTAKRIVFSLLTVVLSVMICALVCVGCQKKGSDVQLVKLSDIHIPEHLDTDNLFGLFFFDEEGNIAPTKNGVENVCYDPDKPTIIFIHGMQMNYGYNSYDPFYNPDGVVKKGYNFGVFIWSQLADCTLPGNGKTKIWGRTNGSFFYEDEQGKRVEETVDVLKYSTAEVFVAYWLDFVEKAGCNSSTVTFAGHSLGANTLFAVTSYMTKLYDEGLITKDYLPDRCTYLDAYLDAFEDATVEVPWLKHTIEKGGIVKLGREAVLRARELGISTDYVASSIVSSLSDTVIYGGEPGTLATLYDNMTYLDYNCDYANPVSAHVACIYWIFNTIDRDIYDINDPTEYCYNFNTPVSYSYARNGAKYSMNSNRTESNFSDDQHFVANVEKPKIAGFAFNDVNKNGINDDRIKNRVAGIKVALYSGDTLVAETVTTEGGYYEFELTSADIGKDFTVKVTLDSGMKITNGGNAGYMDNGINAEGISNVKIDSVIDLKIINIGIIKE